jgi:chromosome segregation ATPase
MATATEETAIATSKFPAVVYDITAERIAELRELEKTHDPAASTKAYDEACKFRQTCVKTRTGMDNKRKELKADSLAWGRLVDSTYKSWETPLLEIESAIDAKIKAVDEAKAAARRAKEAAERAKIEAEVEAKRQAEQAIKDAAAAEAKRLADEEAARVKAENDRIAAANKAEADRLAKIAAEQAAEQKKIDDAKAEVEAAKRRQEQAEREAAIKLQAEKDTAARIERERVAAEERKAAQERAAAAEKARVESLRPDVEKIKALADDIDGIGFPEVENDKAKAFLTELHDALEALAERCRGFKA